MSRLKDQQVAAVIGGLTIVAGFCLYWYAQILDTLEMLEMAYG
jgi:hypothetical protein